MNDTAPDAAPARANVPARLQRSRREAAARPGDSLKAIGLMLRGGCALLRARRLCKVSRHARRPAHGADRVGTLRRPVPDHAVAAERTSPLRTLWNAQARLGACALPSDGRDDGVQLPRPPAAAARPDGDGDLPRPPDRRAARRPLARRVGRLAAARGDLGGFVGNPDRRAPGHQPAPGVRLRVRRGARRSRSSCCSRATWRRTIGRSPCCSIPSCWARSAWHLLRCGSGCGRSRSRSGSCWPRSACSAGIGHYLFIHAYRLAPAPDDRAVPLCFSS